MKPNGTLKYRVGELEKDVKVLGIDVKEILTNHLPHINTSITALNGKIKTMNTKIDAVGNRIIYASVFNVGAIILGLIVSKAF
jgi:hypothetical protein